MSEETREPDERELLSALVDGQVTPKQVRTRIDTLLQDSALQLAWSRYWLISDVLKHNLTGDVGSELLDRVKQSVHAEAALPAPQSRARPRRWSSVRPGIGFALAASVAVVGLLGVLTLGERPDDSQETVAAKMEPAAARERSARMRWDVGQPGVEERLNRYLVTHSEYESGVRGMLSYARVVGYDGRD